MFQLPMEEIKQKNIFVTYPQQNRSKPTRKMRMQKIYKNSLMTFNKMYNILVSNLTNENQNTIPALQSRINVIVPPEHERMVARK